MACDFHLPFCIHHVVGHFGSPSVTESIFNSRNFCNSVSNDIPRLCLFGENSFLAAELRLQLECSFSATGFISTSASLFDSTESDLPPWFHVYGSEMHAF